VIGYIENFLDKSKLDRGEVSLF